MVFCFCFSKNKIHIFFSVVSCIMLPTTVIKKNHLYYPDPIHFGSFRTKWCLLPQNVYNVFYNTHTYATLFFQQAIDPFHSIDNYSYLFSFLSTKAKNDVNMCCIGGESFGCVANTFSALLHAFGTTKLTSLKCSTAAFYSATRCLSFLLML